LGKPGTLKPALGHLQGQVHQVALQKGQDRLGLGVAKAGVELQDLGALLGQHQARVDHPPVDHPLGLKATDEGPEDLLLHPP